MSVNSKKTVTTEGREEKNTKACGGHEMWESKSDSLRGGNEHRSLSIGFEMRNELRYIVGRHKVKQTFTERALLFGFEGLVSNYGSTICDIENAIIIKKTWI